MAPPKTPPQHCVIGAGGGPNILLTCSRGEVFRGSILFRGRGEPKGTLNRLQKAQD